jgi:hypothetical protein
MFLKVPNNTRYELKFIAYEHNYQTIINWIKLHELNFTKEYNTRLVNNIYFDSHNYESFKSNIYGDSSRIKMRYRWYGDIEDSNKGNFEIKFKRNLYGWKKRFDVKGLNLKEKKNWKFFTNLINSDLPDKEKLLFKFNSNPKIINQYSRDYFISSDKKLRITMDKNHVIYDQRYFSYPNFNKKTFHQKSLVMEFKFDRKDRLKIDKLMKYIPMRSSRNSKYVNSIRAVSGF